MARRSSARLTTSTANAASTTGFVRAFRWAEFGAVLGLVTAVVAWAPAAWLASAVSSATHQRLVLADARGTLWNGSARLILSPGPGSRDASELPQRLGWTMRPGWIDGGPGLRLTLDQSCCIKPGAPLTASFGLDRLTVRLPDATPEQPWIRWPAGWLSGLGTPWNTLQLGGSLRLSARELRLEWVQGRWRQFGDLQLDLLNLSSRVSTVAPLGSYRFSVNADPANPGVSTLRLSTLEGALQLSGTGTLNSGGKSRFTGEAGAAPGREEALNNLLNIIGRRQGARSVLTIG